MQKRRRARPVVTTLSALAVGAFTLACAANAGVAPPPATATAVISGAITTSRATPPPVLTPPPTVVSKLDANTASANQMRAAFAAAGIFGAAEWAAAIEDGRPYPADDASWSKLRSVLTKAGAPSASIEQIITLLTR